MVSGVAAPHCGQVRTEVRTTVLTVGGLLSNSTVTALTPGDFRRSVPPPSLTYQMVKRQGAGSAAQQNVQHRCPLNMRRPRLRVNKNLDHGGHPEQNQRGGPDAKAEHQQHRHTQFYRYGNVCRHIRRQYRQPVFVAKQFECRIPVRELGHRRIPENRCDREAQRNGEHPVRHALQQRMPLAICEVWA